MKLSSNSNDMEGTVTASDEVTLKSSTRVLKFFTVLSSPRPLTATMWLQYRLLCFIVWHKDISGEKQERDRYPVTKESLRARV